MDAHRSGCLSCRLPECAGLEGSLCRGWTFALPPRESDRSPGNLDVPLSQDTLQLSFPVNGRSLDLPVVLLGFENEMQVLRGENRNRILPQSFVGLTHAVHAASDHQWKAPLPRVRARG
jgi:hypothetical protein